MPFSKRPEEPGKNKRFYTLLVLEHIHQCHVATQRITQQMNILIIFCLQETVYILGQSTYGSMQYIQLKQRQHRYYHFVMMTEVFNKVFKIT